MTAALTRPIMAPAREGGGMDIRDAGEWLRCAVVAAVLAGAVVGLIELVLLLLGGE